MEFKKYKKPFNAVKKYISFTLSSHRTLKNDKCMTLIIIVVKWLKRYFQTL